MSTAKFNTWQNPDGTENYKCRAWVNFNGTGTVAIRASGNVSSITDNGVGDYTVNFTTALPDADYATTGTAGLDSLSNGWSVFYANTRGGAPFQEAPTTTAVRITTATGISDASRVDVTYINVAIFR